MRGSSRHAGDALPTAKDLRRRARTGLAAGWLGAEGGRQPPGHLSLLWRDKRGERARAHSPYSHSDYKLNVSGAARFLGDSRADHEREQTRDFKCAECRASRHSRLTLKLKF